MRCITILSKKRRLREDIRYEMTSVTLSQRKARRESTPAMCEAALPYEIKDFNTIHEGEQAELRKSPFSQVPMQDTVVCQSGRACVLDVVHGWSVFDLILTGLW